MRMSARNAALGSLVVSPDTHTTDLVQHATGSGGEMATTAAAAMVRATAGGTNSPASFPNACAYLPETCTPISPYPAERSKCATNGR